MPCHEIPQYNKMHTLNIRYLYYFIPRITVQNKYNILKYLYKFIYVFTDVRIYYMDKKFVPRNLIVLLTINQLRKSVSYFNKYTYKLG